MAVWKRLPQVNEGQDYWFAGQCYLTHGVDTNLSPVEVLAILDDRHEFVREKQGIDSTYRCMKGKEVYVFGLSTRCQDVNLEITGVYQIEDTMNSRYDKNCIKSSESVYAEML